MEKWLANDQYINHHLVKEPAPLTAATADIRTTTLPQMEVSPAFGKFLYLMAKIKGATRILELGTYYGYSSLWFAKATPPHATITTCELVPLFAQRAQNNINAAGYADKIKIHHGDALDILPQLINAGEAPYDLIFIDAHKPSYPQYLPLVLQLSKPGTVIIGDNIILDGELANQNSTGLKVIGAQGFVEGLAALAHVESTALQTVGVKGYDGFTVSLVEG